MVQDSDALEAKLPCAWTDLWRMVHPLLLPSWCLNWAAGLKDTVFISSPIGMCLSRYQSLTSKHNQVDCRWRPRFKPCASKQLPRKLTQDRDFWQISDCNWFFMLLRRVCANNCDTPQSRRETAGSCGLTDPAPPATDKSGCGASIHSCSGLASSPMLLSLLIKDHSVELCLSHAIQIQRRNACLKHSRLFKVNKNWSKHLPFFVRK